MDLGSADALAVAAIMLDPSSPRTPQHDSSITDEVLVRVMAGDRAAIESMYARFESRILAALGVEIGSEAIASVDRAELRRWVVTEGIAREAERSCTDLFRARWWLQRLAREYIGRASIASAVSGGGGMDQRAVSRTPTGIRRHPKEGGNEDLRARIHEALGTLPNRYRLLLEMRVRGRATLEEVARALDCSERLAEMLERRALGKFREAIEKSGVGG